MQNTSSASPQLSTVKAWPDGIIHQQKGGLQGTVIEKAGNELRLKLISPESNEWQSRIDLENPIALLSPYMQVMMLALLWNAQPAAVHVLGLGGGRMPAFLRYHFPELCIDCTEIDPEVYELAKKFFGFQPDAKLRVIIQDGREYLAKRLPATLYDIIFIDAFRGVGFSPVRLATQEFLGECKAQLQPAGFLAVNVLPFGALVGERIATVRSVFRSVYLYHGNGALVVFASDAEQTTPDDLATKAASVQGQHHFAFPFESMAASLFLASANEAAPFSKGEVSLLTDATRSDSLIIPEQLLRDIGRNEHCPCGSGRKFKKCHGAPR